MQAAGLSRTATSTAGPCLLFCFKEKGFLREQFYLQQRFIWVQLSYLEKNTHTQTYSEGWNEDYLTHMAFSVSLHIDFELTVYWHDGFYIILFDLQNNL